MKNFISNSKTVLIVFFIIIIGFLLIKNDSLEKEYQENQIILIDSLRDYENRIGELYKQKDFYITTNKELEKINKQLYKEIKNLKDNPIIISNTETIIKIDSIFIKSENRIDSLNGDIINNYKYNDNYISMLINHKLSHGIGTLNVTEISSTANITHSIIEDKNTKKLSIITKTDNPYLLINDVNGGFIDLNNSKTLERYYKRKNTWSLSVSGGYAITYDISTRKIATGPSIMIGISKSLIQW